MKIKSGGRFTASLAGAIIASGLAALIVAGQASAVEPHAVVVSGPNDMITPSQVPAAFAADKRDFPEALPVGVRWPTEAPDFLTAKGVMNEKGLTAMTLAFYWQCAWEKAYLDSRASGDVASSDLALEKLYQFESLPIVQAHWSDPEGSYRAQVLAPASAGDQTGIQMMFTNGCQVFTQNDPDLHEAGGLD